MNGKDEFIALSWIGAVAIFAAGFLLAEAIESLRAHESAAAEFFVAIMFALIARGEACGCISSGSYCRRFLLWRRQ